jgi:hypothetical protein
MAQSKTLSPGGALPRMTNEEINVRNLRERIAVEVAMATWWLHVLQSTKTVGQRFLPLLESLPDSTQL